MFANHAICRACWDKRCAVEGTPGREPTALRTPPLIACCYCQEPTRDGIYLRDYNAQARCAPHDKSGPPPELTN